MRKILTKDVFSLARIIKKANIKEGIKDIEVTDVDTKKVGLQLIVTIIAGCGDAEKEIYTLIKDLTDKDIENMEIKETIEIIKKLAEENDLMGFFEQATQLTL